MTISCDTCQNEADEFQHFKVAINLKFQGKILTLMGEPFTKPSFDVELTLCQTCAISLMNDNKGILIDG